MTGTAVRRRRTVVAIWIAIASAVGASVRVMTADARDFSGRWESANDDGTMTSVLEIQVSGTTVSGAGADVERGFFSG